MNARVLVCTSLLICAGAVADEPPAAAPDAQARVAPEQGGKKLLGISILGNQEAPKALVLVPWKSSQLGDTEGISRSLDDSRAPVDRDVFMRELAYYEIREGTP